MARKPDTDWHELIFKAMAGHCPILDRGDPCPKCSILREQLIKIVGGIITEIGNALRFRGDVMHYGNPNGMMEANAYSQGLFDAEGILNKIKETGLITHD